MALAAATVVDTLAARLTGLGLTGSRVYTDRFHPLEEADLPAWVVTAEDETVEQSIVEGANEHRLTVACAGYVQAQSGADDAMHALAAQGLAALCALPAPYGLQLASLQREPVESGEARLARITCRVLARYWVRPEAPEVIL